jgi:GNAT superfamily N-acetyltransferase
MGEIVFSEAHQGDEEAIAAFLRFEDPSVLTREYWSYRPTDSVFALGKDGDRIVATEALMPYELSVFGKRMLTGRSERTLVDPAYRGKNIWHNIMAFVAERARERGMAFVWGSTSARKPFESVGYSFLEGHRLHMYAATSVSAVAAYTVRLAAKGELHPRLLRERIKRRRKHELEQYAILGSALPSLLARLPGAAWAASSSQTEIRTDACPFGEIDALYQRLGVHDRDIYLPQDAAFNDWLSARTKLGGDGYFAYDGGRLVGYVYVSRGDTNLATIWDFAFETKLAAVSLIQRVRADLAARGCAFFKISVNVRHPVQQGYLAALTASGFIPLHRGGSHVVLPIHFTDRSVLDDMSRWYLTDLSYVL